VEGLCSKMYFPKEATKLSGGFGCHVAKLPPAGKPSVQDARPSPRILLGCNHDLLSCWRPYDLGDW